MSTSREAWRRTAGWVLLVPAVFVAGLAADRLSLIALVLPVVLVLAWREASVAVTSSLAPSQAPASHFRGTYHGARLTGVYCGWDDVLVLELAYEESLTEDLDPSGRTLRSVPSGPGVATLPYRSLDTLLDSGEMDLLRRWIEEGSDLLVTTHGPDPHDLVVSLVPSPRAALRV